MTTLKIQPLLTKIGEPLVSVLGSVWQPWPQEDLWEILKGVPTDDAYAAESLRLHRYLYPYPLEAVVSGSIRSEIHYDTIDLQRYDFADSALYFRWLPSINAANPDYYMQALVYDTEDGDNDTWIDVEIEVGAAGTPGLAVASPLPTQPGVDAGWKTHAWSPDGDYLATGGDPNEVNLYSWDGSELTLEATYDPRHDTTNTFWVHVVTWDPTSTYLAVGGAGGETSPPQSNVAWFKRTGATLTKLPAVELIHPNDPAGAEPDVYALDWHPSGDYLVAGHLKRYRHALSVFKRSGDASLDLIFPDPALPPPIAGYGAWFGWADDPKSDVYGVSWADSTHLAVGHWGGDSDFHYLNMYSWNSVTEELDQISGGAPALPGYVYPYDIEFDPTGTYLTYSTDGGTGPDPDDSFVRVYKHDGSGFLTDLEVELNAAGGGTAWGKAGWDPTGTYFVAGIEYRTGSPGSFVFHKVLSWMKRTGDTFEKLTDLDLKAEFPTWTNEDPTSVFWHPSDPVLAGVAYAGGAAGPWLYLVDVTGLGAGPVMNIDIQGFSSGMASGDLAAGSVTVTPYDPDTHGWLRIRHDSVAGKIYVDTAPVGCGTWTIQLEVAVTYEVNVAKMAILMNSWVDTNSGDAEAAEPGYFGPFNPVPSDFTLPLLTLIGEAPLVDGITIKALPLLTKIST